MIDSAPQVSPALIPANDTPECVVAAPVACAGLMALLGRAAARRFAEVASPANIATPPNQRTEP